MAFQRVLIAVDNEPVAARAADTGIELAQKLGAEVAFINVVDPKTVGTPESGICASMLLSQAHSDARRLLAAFSGRFSPDSGALEFVQVGRAATEIVNTAKQWAADFIVLGSHGRCGMQRAILGSVAEEVIRHAPCPVLVVRVKC